MKQILGSFFMLFIIPSILLASVSSRVDKKEVYSGDEVRYTIVAIGEKPVFPIIKKIAGYDVLKITSKVGITDDYNVMASQTYIFAPSKQVDIPEYKVMIGDKEYKTSALHVNIKNPILSKNGGDVGISLHVDKTEVFVGEPIHVNVQFSYKKKADEMQVGRLKIENFWIKSIDKPLLSKKDGFFKETYKYIIFPQQQGSFNIPQVEVSIGVINKLNKGGNVYQDPFASSEDELQWSKYLSNTISLHVKPLPQKLELFGDFNLYVKVDKNKVKANKPINLSISVKGVGNIDDIRPFAFDINDTVAYFNEPTIKSLITNDIYSGIFTQKVSLIGDKNFIIPPLTLKYFDKITQKVLVKKSKPIYIKVLNSTKKNETNPYIKYIYLLFGFILGILFMLFLKKKMKINKPKKDIPIISKIKKSKNDKELFLVLLSYENKNKYIDETLEKLEENIYKNAKNKIVKKELIKKFISLQCQ